MDFENYLKANAQKIDQELDKILSKLPSLAKAFVDSCGGGKRIRGVLCKLGYEIASTHLRGEIIKVAAALEIMHTAILAHDDIMDKSLLRRDKPSLYASVGIDQALALGDLGFFFSLQIISESNFPSIRKNEALKLFSKVMVDTAIGQIMDLKKADPMIVARLKTAQYTILGPLCLGAILAGADEKLLKLFREFGENLGIAFQIRDDILDGEAPDQSQADAVEYANKSKRLIPKITSDPKLRQLLMSMTDYIVERIR